MYIEPIEKAHKDTVTETEYNVFVEDITDHEARILSVASGGGAVANLAIGSVIMYYGNLGLLDAGWHVCDGTNGTPDLRDKFIVGAGASFSVGAIGGVLTHTHSGGDLANAGSHNHSFSFTTGGGGTATASLYTGTGTSGAASSSGHAHGSSGASTSSDGTHGHSGGPTGAASGLPPFKALYYIMRIA